MKKLLIPIILIAVAGIFFYTQNSNKDVSPTDLSMDSLGTPTNKDSMQEENKMDKPEETMMEGTGYKYEITEPSTASYVAQKRFLSKEDQVVVGTTSNITGSGWYDPETGTVQGEAMVDLSTLQSDTSKRDSDILKFFTPPTAYINFNNNKLSTDVVMDVTQNQTLTADLTINNVTKSVDFEVETMVTEDMFKISGAGNIMMSDFNIDPPSLLNVYTVDDEIELRLDISGNRIN